jgi:hypothetical protein
MIDMGQDRRVEGLLDSHEVLYAFVDTPARDVQISGKKAERLQGR